MNTGALVSRAGSIDWFCAPRFDSRAVFAALLGEREHGRWLLAPLESVNPAPVEEVRTERSYRENTFILQTVWFVGDASVRVTEFMPLSGGTTIVRNVEGLTGEVTMYHELAMRFDYGIRDSSFASSPEKINVFEIFKLLAPNTNVRVI